MLPTGWAGGSYLSLDNISASFAAGEAASETHHMPAAGLTGCSA
jgi:hypothetical protein